MGKPVHNRNRPWVKAIIGSIVGAILLISVAMGLIFHDMQGHTHVKYYPSTRITNIYFYRSTCSDCQRSYPQAVVNAFWHKLHGKDTLFINTKDIHGHDELNKAMVQTYNITQVPTMIKVDQHGALLH